MKIKTQTYNCLHEALLRYENFRIGWPSHRKVHRKWSLKSLQEGWTGLGYPSEYKQAVEDGFMKPASKVRPKCMGWYYLTEKGARVVKHWHDTNYSTLEYSLGNTPPMNVNLEL